MKPNTTIYDIAEKLGITAATVSRALNDNPKISKKTRELVLKTAKELNYQRNNLALALKSGSSKNIGVVVPYINRNFFSSVIRGIEEELYPKGYQTIICQTHEDEAKEKAIFNSLINNNIDGILISISKNTVNTDHYEKAKRAKTPIVFFDRKKDIEGISSVSIDDFEGGYNATEHLIKTGHDKIAHISGDLKLDIYTNRYEGYKKALEDYNIPFNPNYLFETSSSIDAGKKMAKKILKLKDKPNGIFCAGDFVALGLIQELNSDKKIVPQEIGVVGFGNEPFTELVEVSMSTIDQNPYKMGKTTASVLLEQIEDTSSSIEKKVILESKLIPRESSI